MTPQVSEFADRVREACPLATVDLDPPLYEHGRHHIDVRLGDRLVVVELGEQRAIGVSLVLDAALETGPDFYLANEDAALALIKLLLWEAQDADLSKQLGSWTAESREAVEYEDLAVNKRERRAPRRIAA